MPTCYTSNNTTLCFAFSLCVFYSILQPNHLSLNGSVVIQYEVLKLSQQLADHIQENLDSSARV